MTNDPPIHLPPSAEPYTEASVTCPVWITQSSLDGLAMLIKFCEGMEASGRGKVPGSFELVVFYRTLKSCIHEHLSGKPPQILDPSNVPITTPGLFSPRVRELIRRAGINGLLGLASATEDELLEMRNCGPGTLEEIKAVLAKYGLSLKESQ